MSEIPSAEEFALKIDRVGRMQCVDPNCKVCAENKKEAATLVRARDKAIVERYEELIDICGSDKECARKTILRELGGEQ